MNHMLVGLFSIHTFTHTVIIHVLPYNAKAPNAYLTSGACNCFRMLLFYLPSDDVEAPFFHMVCAGGQCDQLISELRSDTCIET